MDADLRPTIRTLARLARMLERACTEVSLPQYRVLAMIDSGDERATQLAGHLALTKPTITAAVDGLVERGLLKRETVAGDRRAVKLTVTDEGRSVLATSEQTMSEWLGALLERSGNAAATIDAMALIQKAIDEAIGEMLGAAARKPQP